MKKKLSLLLASLLVMTLVPVSSFAYGKDVTKSYDAEIGDTGKTVIVEYKVNPGEIDVVTGTSVQFDVSNEVKIKGFEAKNKANQDLGFTVTSSDFGDDTIVASIPGTLAATATDGLYYFVFTLDFDDEDIVEGDYVLNSAQPTSTSSKISISDLKLGTISEKASDSLTIKVKDTNVKKVSKEGGKLSEFVVTNFINTAPTATDEKNVKIELDNNVSWTTDTEVRIDRMVYNVPAANISKDGSVLTIPGSVLTDKDDINVIPVVKGNRNTGLTSIVAGVTNGDADVEATVGEVVDYEVTMKAVAKGKKEIESIVAGKTSEVEVTIESVKGTLANRLINFELDGAYLADAKLSNIYDMSNIDGAVTIDDEDGYEFSFTPKTDATKIKFTMKLKADPDAADGVATLTATGRDLTEDITVDVLNVDKAFDIETKVTPIRRGESLATADIEISEIKAGQIAAGDYITLAFNGRLEFNDKPSIETSNGLKLKDVEWTYKNNQTAISAKVETRSKGEPGTISVSDVAVDLATNAIHDKVYTISLLIGDKTTNTDVKDNATLGLAKEYAEFDYVKCVAEYAKKAPKIVLTLGSANYTVDGVVMTLEAPVFTKDNRTMLPIGPLALAMGLEVNYNGDTQTATFRDPGTGQIVSVKENASVLYNNGIEYKMHTSAVTVNNRIFVPVASMTDAFGAKIVWDEATQSVTIN